MPAVQHFDVWLVETKAVYRGVPYDVVADWAQQGRVTPDDMIRPAGGEDWGRLDASAFRPFLPGMQAPPAPVAVAAEEETGGVSPPPAAHTGGPVEFDDIPARRRADEDDDVDMIPLIDISLVLLVFFMMTASAAPLASPVRVPEVAAGADVSQAAEVRIDVAPVGDAVRYAITFGGEAVKGENAGLDRDGVLAKLDEHLKAARDAVTVHVAADREASYEAVRDLAADLYAREKTGRGILRISTEVSERKP